MIEMVEIRITQNKNTVFLNKPKFPLKENITVVLETEKGLEFGIVVNASVMKNIENIEAKEHIIRVSNKRDYLNYKNNMKEAQLALKKARELTQEIGLSMHIIDAYFNLDRSKLFFRFLADSRVDFRDLAKELAGIYKTRIELRQIGIRDKAKEIGGIGLCGRCLCCNKFLKDFDTVSISMAKNQNLSLNPNKINGVCGRLLCCLKYENDCYKECKKNMPKVGQFIETEKGLGKVLEVDILNNRCTADVKNYGKLEIGLKNGKTE